MNDMVKKIKGSKNYYVTADGFIFKKYGDYNFKLVSPTLNSETGYYMVTIGMTKGHQINRTVHRLVAEAFLKKPKNVKNLEIAHLDNDKSNNAVINLKYMTHAENMKAGWQQGLFNRVSEAIANKRKSLKGQRSELTEADVRQIRHLRNEKLTNKEVAFIFDLHPNQVSRIFNRRSFANVQ